MEIKLNQNLRQIELLSLNQEQHYRGGFMTGYPDTEMNDMIIDELTHEYNSKSLPVIIISPVRYDKKHVEEINKVRYSDDIDVELLPAILCKASFYSNRPTGWEKDKDFSELNIIWFQDEFDSTLKNVLSLIKQVDWDKYAKSYSWDEF